MELHQTKCLNRTEKKIDIMFKFELFSEATVAD